MQGGGGGLKHHHTKDQFEEENVGSVGVGWFCLFGKGSGKRKHRYSSEKKDLLKEKGNWGERRPRDQVTTCGAFHRGKQSANKPPLTTTA